MVYLNTKILFSSVFTFLILITSSINTNGQSSTLAFDIEHHGNVIGQLTAKQSSIGDKTHYKSTSKIEFRIGKEIQVLYSFDVNFIDEILQLSDAKITIDDKTFANTSTKWDNTHYHITKSGEDQISHKEPIRFSTIQLYFKEPLKLKRIFSEQQGSFNTIESIGNHIYKMTNSKGNESLYHYKQGKLIKAEIDGGLIEFQILSK